MRFDDRLATVLSQPAQDAPAREAAWRQLVDLLAQSAGEEESETAAEAYRRLREWRDAVGADTRRTVARSLAGHRLPVALVRFFAEDHASVAAPVLGTARLNPSEWVALIPALSPTARALLRHRRDLGGEAERALAQYGQTDLVIAGPAMPVSPALAALEPEPQPKISDLVARIEAFRREHRPLPPIVEQPHPHEAIEAFAFETDWAGTIFWVDAEDRGPLIGLSLSAAPELFAQGFDGQASGAFRRRAAFRDARLLVAGQGPAAGEWRVSGVPWFDERNGRFLGYRGNARRPLFTERAEVTASGLYGSNVTPDSLRSLVHELRTPLNAIIGFAEMIDRQILGPVSTDYRAQAHAILSEAQRLADAVDDLDAAARIETRSLRHEPGSVDAAALLARIERQLARPALTVRADMAPLAVAGDRLAVERMFTRLLAAVAAVAAPGEPLAIALRAEGGSVRLTVDRPAALASSDEDELLDPGYSPDGDWPDAPLLGLGFSLRLVRSLAEANGGWLTIESARFTLTLPAVTAPAEDTLVQS